MVDMIISNKKKKFFGSIYIDNETIYDHDEKKKRMLVKKKEPEELKLFERNKEKDSRTYEKKITMSASRNNIVDNKANENSMGAKPYNNGSI
ncbi:hypothetical protein DERF_006776 [Dermatophagoides farinae]|uniref:Uncharacterized protein n=1 Tax=Dermatophagoides farinae TaxID=6954 RepID=A0A922L2Y6_DERFA|nr:hypothetical protein DERF_006776 [Dermatophagoides farinae]